MKPIHVVVLLTIMLGAGCVPTSTVTKPTVVGDEEAVAPTSVGKEVVLSGQGLEAVPAEVFQRQDVTLLDVSDNDLTGALPAEIRHMRSLRVLNASGNRMTGVPAEIGQLRELRVLDLSDNEITGLPYELGGLRNLEMLNLSGNPYSEADLERIEATLPKTTVITR